MLSIKEIVRPKTLADTWDCLGKGDWKITAGGTDVLPAVRDGRLKDICLLDLDYLKDDLGKIYESGGCLHVGALATHDGIVHSELVNKKFKVLAQACQKIGSAQIRKRATIGGNIVNASPAADSVPALLAAKARVCVKSGKGERQIPLGDFLKGPGRTDLKKGEILTEVCIPLPAGGGRWQGEYMKVGGRSALVISIAGAAVLRTPEGEFRVACGSVGPTVLRAERTEQIMNRGNVSLEKIKEALEQDISPIDDVRASGRYRKMVMANMLWNMYGNWKEGM